MALNKDWLIQRPKRLSVMTYVDRCTSWVISRPTSRNAGCGEPSNPATCSGGRSSPSQTTSSRHSFRSEEPGHGADTTQAAALCFSGSRPHWKQSVENVFAEKAYKSYEFATDTFCYELSEIRDV